MFNRLATDQSVATRTSTAVLLSQQFNTQALSAAETKLAHEIFKIMVRDAEVRVREALAANLKENPGIPHDVALSLANDVDSVSLPILAYSEVLTTADLVEIINAQPSLAKMGAIAGRQSVDETVATALVEQGSENVVAGLMSNPDAAISEKALHRAVDRFGETETVLEPMIQRATLPITVSERLVTRVANHLRTQLLAKHQISADIATDLVLHTRERATVGLAMGVGDDALAALAKQLKSNGRLTTSLILRAICMGNAPFFEHALATLASIPVANARLLAHESSGAGLCVVWTKTGQGEHVLPVIRAVVEAAEQAEAKEIGA